MNARLGIDGVDPGACCGIDVTRADPEAVHVRFEYEIASAPVVGHLVPRTCHPEDPSLVAEAVDRLVSGDDFSPAESEEKALSAAIASCASEAVR